MTKSDKRENKKVRVLALALMGAGLVLAGAAVTALVIDGGRQARAYASDDLSVSPVPVDFAAPALSLPNLSGRTESLEQYLGQVVLVNNWATWCPPCKAEMPTLQDYYAAHAAEGFTVIAIEAGSPAAEVREFASEFGLTFPVWVDVETAALEAFQNGHLPNSYVIDRSGTVRLAWIGEISRAALEQSVTPLLSEGQ
jgi:peroxiredoxin